MNEISETMPADSAAVAAMAAEVDEPAALEAAETEAAAVTDAAVPATTRRADTVAEDAALVSEAEALLASLAGDPLMAVELVQSWLRELGIDVREDTALSNQERTRLSEALADAAHELEAQARASAAESNLIGQIFGWIGTAIAIAVSLVTSVFTGGASLALGVAAVACMVAAQTVTVLGQEGIIDDPNWATGISTAFSVLATALSFGASAAGSATQSATTAGTAAAQAAAKAALEAAQAALDVIETLANVASTVVGVAGGISSMVETCFTHDANMSAIEGEREELAADEARAVVDDTVGDLGALMRQFRQMAERMAEVREARAAAMSAAIIRV